ncbi:MAG TPA: class I SAM-dependent rRNA methyltransferase [Gammaproteobacteria bacterium]|nr:class I SAM-dependent rRNA methyltransferase [Gammaproteobacteria bacterium]
MTLPPLKLRKNEDRRLRAGHLWVFSNEVDVEATPLTAFEPGTLVEIQAHDGRAVGTGYVNPRSLICARLLSRDPAHPAGPSLLVHRLKVALALRERIYGAPYYRLVFGEGDGLPGLVVDRYGDVLVAQLTTAGMERLKDDVVAALIKVLKPAGILFRNDAPVRELEGLERYVAIAHGTVPERVTVEEDGLVFEVALQEGQKTGWFYDQRDNRARLARYVRGRRVLDVFSYVGAWGVRAAAAGAAEVLCVDSSTAALELARANAARNGVALGTVEDDAFEALRRLREARERFDVVIVDPPAFIKRRRDHREGLKAYHGLNRLAMQVLARDGLLVSCSCSQHLARAELHDVILREARHLERTVGITEQGGQGPDHPVHPAIPETEYLKVVFARVLPA